MRPHVKDVDLGGRRVPPRAESLISIIEKLATSCKRLANILETYFVKNEDTLQSKCTA